MKEGGIAQGGLRLFLRTGSSELLFPPEEYLLCAAHQLLQPCSRVLFLYVFSALNYVCRSVSPGARLRTAPAL
eukprot:4949484-Amphidinium_carterae.2